MDPVNTNLNENTVAASVNPEMPVNPAAAASPEVPLSPEIPVESVAPISSAASINPAALAAPEVPVSSAMPEMPTPVNPVIKPGETVMPSVAPGMVTAEPSPAAPVTPDVVGASPVANQNTVTSEGIMVGATDPITIPNPPKAPDPVEEELKAPMTAAAPVPGSIGSAISVPTSQPVGAASGATGVTMDSTSFANGANLGQMPNVAFNDPAVAQQGQSTSVAAQAIQPAKKKMDKKTLIMLCAVAGIVVVALVIVLIMMLNQ